MKLVATRLIRTAKEGSVRRKLFAEPLSHEHLCLGIIHYSEPTHAKNAPAIFISSPEQPSFPLGDMHTADVFLAWFDIEWKDNLEDFIPMLVRRGNLPLNGMIQNLLPTFQYISEAVSSAGFKKIALEKCLEATMYAIITYMISEKEHIKNTIDRAVIYMEENIHRPLSLEDISSECNISKEHLIRLFKKNKNMTPMKYFSNMRLRKSMEMLADGKKIHQIVTDLNFYNDSYFCKLFKRHFGFTTGHFKKRENRSGNVSLKADNESPASLMIKFINQMSDIFFIKDSNLNTIACNRAYCELAGLPYTDIIGKNDFELYPEREALFFRMGDKFIRDSGRDGVFRKWLPFPDGKRYYVETRKTPYYDEQGNFLGILCLSRRIRDEDEIIVSEADEGSELEQ